MITEIMASDVLRDALARVLADHRREADAHLATVRAQYKQEVAELKVELAEFKARLQKRADDEIELIEKIVMDRLAELKDGKDGRDGVDGQPGETGATGEAGPKGDPGELGPAGADGREGAAGQPGEKGEPGERGLDGKDGTNGLDGRDGVDGIGLAGAFIDRDGELTLTMTDGRTKALGLVVGRDGPPGLDGKDGMDGMSWDGVEFDYDGERRLAMTAVLGDEEKQKQLVMPIVIDRGVYRPETVYEKGDGVTWAGSWWIAQKDAPAEKPGENGDWRLAVKRGRDGKDGKDGAKGDPGPEGKPFQAKGKP